MGRKAPWQIPQPGRTRWSGFPQPAPRSSCNQFLSLHTAPCSAPHSQERRKAGSCSPIVGRMSMGSKPLQFSMSCPPTLLRSSGCPAGCGDSLEPSSGRGAQGGPHCWAKLPTLPTIPTGKAGLTLEEARMKGRNPTWRWQTWGETLGLNPWEPVIPSSSLTRLTCSLERLRSCVCFLCKHEDYL